MWRKVRIVLYIVIVIVFICGNTLMNRAAGFFGDMVSFSPEDGGESLAGDLDPSYTEYGDLDGFYYLIQEGRAVITGYAGEEVNLELPANIKGFPVTEIGEGAFSGNTLLKSVSSRRDIEVIGSRAFSGCSALETVELGEKIARVGTEALDGTKFNSAQQMERGYVTLGNMLVGAPLSGEYYIPEGVTAIAPGCFRENENVTEVILPEGMLYLGDEVFYRCPNLTKAVFPAGMEEIGERVFGFCENLEEITFQGSVRRIGHSAFEGCEKYGDIIFPEGLEEIGERAFWECGEMTSIVIPGTVKKIGRGAFGNAMNYQQVTRLELKEGVEEVGDSAFRYVNAEEVILPKSLVATGREAFELTDEMEVAPGMYVASGVLLLYRGEEKVPVVPEGVTMIGGHAFQDNGAIVSVTLPEGLKVIGNSAFENCGELSYVTLPGSVEVWGDRAFSYCSKLTIVTGRENVPRKGEAVFEGSGIMTEE